MILGIFCGSTMPTQHTTSTGFLCGRPVAFFQNNTVYKLTYLHT